MPIKKKKKQQSDFFTTRFSSPRRHVAEMIFAVYRVLPWGGFTGRRRTITVDTRQNTDDGGVFQFFVLLSLKGHHDDGDDARGSRLLRFYTTRKRNTDK